MEQIILTKEEVAFLKRYDEGKYNPITATVGEQNLEIALIDKASKFEEENGLVDERIDYSPDCDLLKWFYYRYQIQE